jgi:hypothetical protein
MEAINLDLSMRNIELQYDFIKDKVIISLQIENKILQLILSEIIYFSLSNPNNMIFPLISDSSLKIINSTVCREILTKRYFGFIDFNISNRCYHFYSESSIVLEIIANMAEEKIV